MINLNYAALLGGFEGLPYMDEKDHEYTVMPEGVIMCGKVSSKHLPVLAAGSVAKLMDGLRECFDPWVARLLGPYLEPELSVFTRHFFDVTLPTIAQRAWDDVEFLCEFMDPMQAVHMRKCWEGIEDRIYDRSVLPEFRES